MIIHPGLGPGGNNSFLYEEKNHHAKPSFRSPRQMRKKSLLIHYLDGTKSAMCQ
jgi:hypothetical protein